MTTGITRLAIAFSAGMLLVAAAALGVLVLVDGPSEGFTDWVRLWTVALIVSLGLLVTVVRAQLRRGLAEWRAFRSSRDGLSLRTWL